MRKSCERKPGHFGTQTNRPWQCRKNLQHCLQFNTLKNLKRYTLFFHSIYIHKSCGNNKNYNERADYGSPRTIVEGIQMVAPEKKEERGNV